MRVETESQQSGPLWPIDGRGMKQVIRKLGIAGFMFFFVKGLVWLALLGGGAAAVRGCGAVPSTAAIETPIQTLTGVSENKR